MDFRFTEDQRMIRDTARELLAAQMTSAALRAALATPAGWDQQLWQVMAGELGWAGVALPETYGGSGLGLVELAILLEETGRVLAPVPFFTTAGLCATAIQEAASAAQLEQLLPAIAGGESRAAMCLNGPRGCHAPHELPAELSGSRLHGVAHFVAWGQAANLLLVVARAPETYGWEGISLVALPAATPGIVVTPETSMDLTRPYATVRFENVELPGTAVLGAAGRAGPALRRALAVAAILLAAEQLGGAERVLELSVEFAKQRVQFGRPIGGFQAIKHILADMMLRVESGRSAVYYAACAAAEMPDELEEAAAIARSTCTEMFLACAGQAIQVHGGVGFTWDYDPQLFFKRARSSANLLGDVTQHREQLAQIMGLDQ